MNRYLLVTLSTADSAYLNNSKQLLSSAYFQGSWPGDMMVLTTPNLKKQHENEFLDHGILVYKKPLFQQYYHGYVGHHIVYHKLYALQEEFRKWDGILYLDSDIIVNKNLTPILSMDKVGACKCLGCKHFKSMLGGKLMDNPQPLYKKYNVRTRHPFNAGVMYMPREYIGKHYYQLSHRILKDFHWMFSIADQTLFNVLYSQIWEELNPSYNAQLTNIKFGAQHVVHFSTKNHINPWDKESEWYSMWSDNLKKFQDIQGPRCDL